MLRVTTGRHRHVNTTLHYCRPHFLRGCDSDVEQFARLCDVVFVNTHVQTALKDCTIREKLPFSRTICSYSF